MDLLAKMRSANVSYMGTGGIFREHFWDSFKGDTMAWRKPCRSIICGTVILFFFAAAFSRPIIGQATIKLTKPANQETVDNLRNSAYKSFKIDLWEWMKEEADVTVDTSNAIQRFHFQSFADSCFAKLDSKPIRSGYDMSITFAIQGEDARALLEAYNTRCYGISLRYYTLMKTALENNAVNDLYNAGIQTIFYTMGRMGSPIDMPEESTPRSFLLEDSRKIMQNFFNKFSVHANDVLINGKAGTMLATPLTVTALIDTLPLVNILLIGTLPNDVPLCNSKSNAEGVVVFSNFKIPIVARGTLLYFKPDVSTIVPGVPALRPMIWGSHFRSKRYYSILRRQPIHFPTRSIRQMASPFPRILPKTPMSKSF